MSTSVLTFAQLCTDFSLLFGTSSALQQTEAALHSQVFSCLLMPLIIAYSCTSELVFLFTQKVSYARRALLRNTCIDYQTKRKLAQMPSDFFSLIRVQINLSAFIATSSEQIALDGLEENDTIVRVGDLHTCHDVSSSAGVRRLLVRTHKHSETARPLDSTKLLFQTTGPSDVEAPTFAIDQYRPSPPAETWLTQSELHCEDKPKLLLFAHHEYDSTGAETPRNEDAPFSKPASFNFPASGSNESTQSSARSSFGEDREKHLHGVKAQELSKALKRQQQKQSSTEAQHPTLAAASPDTQRIMTNFRSSPTLSARAFSKIKNLCVVLSEVYIRLFAHLLPLEKLVFFVNMTLWLSTQDSTYQRPEIATMALVLGYCVLYYVLLSSFLVNSQVVKNKLAHLDERDEQDLIETKGFEAAKSQVEALSKTSKQTCKKGTDKQAPSCRTNPCDEKRHGQA